MKQQHVLSATTYLHMEINLAYSHEAAGICPRPELSHCIPRYLRGHGLAARMARLSVCASA